MLKQFYGRLVDMRNLFLIIAVFYLKPVQGQSFVYPKLPNSGRSIEALVPSHWKAIDTVFGDLNNDKREDLVLILEFSEPIIEARAYGDGETEIIKEFQRPRMMAIYFKNSNKQYAFALQHNHFILRAKEGGTLGDPYQGTSIDRNTLQLHFSGGSNWRWQLNYHFKYQEHDWQLIAATNRYVNDGSGELEVKDYDFVGKKVKETTGNLKDSLNQSIIVTNLKTGDLKTLSTFKKPWTWEIKKDSFL